MIIFSVNALVTFIFLYSPPIFGILLNLLKSSQVISERVLRFSIIASVHGAATNYCPKVHILSKWFKKRVPQLFEPRENMLFTHVIVL